MKAERFVFGTDSHGDQIDPHTERAFLEFVKHWKPAHKIHGGDAIDFRWLRGRAGEQEQRERIEADVDAGVDFLKKFSPHVFITGNHDFRVWRAAESDDGKMANLAARIIDDIKSALGKAAVLPWCKRKGVHQYGDTRFLHGYHAGVYAARQLALTYGNACCGHVHSSDQASVGTWDRVTGHTSAALCRVDLDYNRGSPSTLRQSNGWLYGWKYPSGRVQVFHAEKIDGAFYFPSEMRECGREGKDRKSA